MTQAIEAGIVEWRAETGVLLGACRRLVEYYGSDDELESFHEAVQTPLWLVEVLGEVASGGEMDIAKSPACSRFSCTEEVATMVTPLMQILVEYRPDFVVDAFEDLDEKSRRRFMLPYGNFLAIVGRYLCGPMWVKYPHLAPPGWPMSVGE